MAAKEDLDLGKEKQSAKKWTFILAAALVLLIGAGVGLYFAGIVHFGKPQVASEAAAVTPVKTAHFYEFDPFIVNFPPGESARLLQIGFSVLTYAEETAAALGKHAPMLRNNLLLLFGRYRPEELASLDGKEALRQAIAQEIQKALEAQAQGSRVEAVFFTQFVMQ
ncbi:hypothetical protein JCM13664_13760 [Methylothermus subterraneus]